MLLSKAYGLRGHSEVFEGGDRQTQLRGTLLMAQECQPGTWQGRAEVQQAGEERKLHPPPHSCVPARPPCCSSGSWAGQHRETRCFQTTSSPWKCHIVCGISTPPHGGCVVPFAALSREPGWSPDLPLHPGLQACQLVKQGMAGISQSLQTLTLPHSTPLI